MADNRDIWVFSEKTGLLGELIAGARGLAGHTGGSVVALVLGPREEAGEAVARGADKALWLGQPAPGVLVEDYVPTLLGLIKHLQPYALLIGATKRGQAVAGRLAARLDVTVLTDVLRFQFDGEALQAEHLIFGGGALRVDQPLAAPVLATVAAGTFEPLAVDGSRQGDITGCEFVAPEWRVTQLERKIRPPVSVDLAAARRVVCAGRGLAKREHLALIEELAQVLGAEVACSRPLAEGLDWLPRERYIGISGAHVKPELYLGVGVSGQVQHTIGMSGSRVVVAINKDAHAPIFAQADYGVVGDLYAVVPALIRAIRARKDKGSL
jgi:electron transfer flavoprotein alpha subunit